MNTKTKYSIISACKYARLVALRDVVFALLTLVDILAVVVVLVVVVLVVVVLVALVLVTVLVVAFAVVVVVALEVLCSIASQVGLVALHSPLSWQVIDCAPFSR